jgi:hypothetical protein
VSDFPKFKPIPRLHREVTLTEKIDGTNGLIDIQWADDPDYTPTHDVVMYVKWEDRNYAIAAGSRSRWIWPGMDNHGFAGWVFANADALVSTLGVGTHYGEWWGSGIQRGYGLQKGEKRFSLFNSGRWTSDMLTAVPGLGVVPILATGNGSELNLLVQQALTDLQMHGSWVAPGFMRPEGVVAYHKAANSFFKVTCEKDDEWKGKSR